MMMMGNEIIEGLNKLRLMKQGCDLSIHIGQRIFVAHRVVLMARMEFFQKLFTAEQKVEKNDNIVVFDPAIVSPDVFDDVLDYIYTTQITLNEFNSPKICVVAKFFRDDKLLCKSENFLKNNLSIKNVANYLSVAQQNELKSLENECKHFIICKSLADVARQELIPMLSYENLKSIILQMKELFKYEDMYFYIINWVQQNENDRKPKLLELLKLIPLENLSFRFLKKSVTKDAIIMRNNDCCQALVMALSSVSQTDCLYVFGGISHTTILSTVSRFDSSSRLWGEATPMLSKRSHFGTAVVDRKIYICGGTDGTKNLVDNHVFDVKTQKWKVLKAMKTPRQSCGVASMNQFIYVAGGLNANEILNSVEKYSVINNEWTDVAPMLSKRQGCELVELNGELYALGGSDGYVALNTAEKYNPIKDEWKEMPKLIFEYNWFGATTFKNRIYVLGFDRFEVYSPLDDKWKDLSVPKYSNIGRRLCTFGGRLIAIGGKTGVKNEQKSMKTFEIYDIEKNCWSTGKEMIHPRSYFGAVVVPGERSPSDSDEL